MILDLFFLIYFSRLFTNIAYEIVAGKIDKKPEITSELIHFNKGNISITKDVMKFKLSKKQKPS